MSVTVHHREGICHINVLGGVRQASQRTLLDFLARSDEKERLEIHFYDAAMLSREVMLALAAVAKRCRVHVYHPGLASCFYRIGLDCRLRSPSCHEHEIVPLSEVKVLALGGSADSLEKILAIIERLPVSGCAVFIVQHIPESKPCKLDQLLKIKTGYALLMPHHRTPVQPGTIHIAPPGFHLRVHDGHVYLTRDRKQSYAQPSIGVLFESLAREYGPHLLAALLCGYGDDGVRALALVRQRGGTVLVEKPEECQASMLVRGAITAGHYDLVAGWREIAALFAAAAQPQVPPSWPMLQRFTEAIESRYGIAFRDYAPGTLQRRIHGLLTKCDIHSFYWYQRQVLAHPSHFERLFLELSIGITEFFRHPPQWRYLRQELLPYLASFPHIRIWIAGCATGETAYSLAILLQESGLLAKSRIYATDINPLYLQQARNGLYGRGALRRMEENYRASGGQEPLERYFHGHRTFLEVEAHLREKILFSRHSLVNDGVFNEFQFILCSNVLIYFSETLRSKVVNLFSRSLHKDGFLMLGQKENLGEEERQDLFRVEDERMKIYRWWQDV